MVEAKDGFLTAWVFINSQWVNWQWFIDDSQTCCFMSCPWCIWTITEREFIFYFRVVDTKATHRNILLPM